jgi:hypothetical protein
VIRHSEGRSCRSLPARPAAAKHRQQEDRRRSEVVDEKRQVAGQAVKSPELTFKAKERTQKGLEDDLVGRYVSVTVTVVRPGGAVRPTGLVLGPVTG